ncbi:MAG TPA: hypothetical protein VGQ91_19325 [Ideonella sp.]|jgi:ElaB/YqjD/DUF883 family membrane-anchored ribosome-binding protein|nr:hypothetical protein [Ideonella sp.]
MATLGSSSDPFPNSPPSNAASSSGSAGTPPAADPTIDRLAQTAHRAVDRMAESAAPAADKLRSGVDQAADALHTQVDRLSELEKEMLETARAAVRSRPITSVAIALAAGLLLGRLLSAR